MRAMATAGRSPISARLSNGSKLRPKPSQRRGALSLRTTILLKRSVVALCGWIGKGHLFVRAGKATALPFSAHRSPAKALTKCANGRGNLNAPLIVFGADLEGAGFWDGITIERRQMGPNWLDDIGTILHPAAITHAPRRLIEAASHGVTVRAHTSCGLAPGQFAPWDEVTADYGALTVA